MEPVQPIVYLDVDGVINDLGVLASIRDDLFNLLHDVIPIPTTPVRLGDRPWNTMLYSVTLPSPIQGQTVDWIIAIPQPMATLIQHLTNTCDVYWNTTWNGEANTHIAPLLGIDPLPVVDNVSILKEDDLIAHQQLINPDHTIPTFWIEDTLKKATTQRLLNDRGLEHIHVIDTTVTPDGHTDNGVLWKQHLTPIHTREPRAKDAPQQ